MRVSLDTNVLVSAFATRGLCADLLQAVLADHQLVLGETVLGELARVLSRKLRTPASAVLEIEGFLRRQAVVIEQAPSVAIGVPDPADQAVVAEAVAGGAEVLVTGDGELLGAAAGAPVPIVTPRAFWELLKVGPRGL